MESFKVAIFGLLLLITMTEGSSYRKRNRCRVKNLPFQRHVDLERYAGRYIIIKGTDPPLRLPFQGRTIAKIATPDTFTTYTIGRDDVTGRCVENLFACQQTKPPGPKFSFTFFNFPDKPTFTDIYLAETNYVSYLVFYKCLVHNHDGTSRTPWVIVESKWNDYLSRRDRMIVSRILRRLCIDESTLSSIQQGERCPEPRDIKYVPLSGPRRDNNRDRHDHVYYDQYLWKK